MNILVWLKSNLDNIKGKFHLNEKRVTAYSNKLSYVPIGISDKYVRRRTGSPYTVGKNIKYQTH